MRTTDTSYGEDYWSSLDSGRGYQDSTMWEDISHIVKEMFAIDHVEHKDRSFDVHMLDVGSAYGYLVRHLRRRGIDACGIDFSQYAIQNSPADVKGFVAQGDVTVPGCWPFRSGQFNSLVSFETMEHIPEDKIPVVVQNIWDWTQPGALLLLTICTENQPGWDTDPTHITIKDRRFWYDAFNMFVNLPRLEDEIKKYWLFSQHDGVFVFRRP